jgi:hypothetical protein
VYLLYNDAPYKGTTTLVGEKHLTLYSNSTSPTSFTFSSTTSSNSALINITNGALFGNDIKIIYDASAVDTFVSLQGTGSISLEYVNVTAGSTSSPSVATKSFIVVSGGGVVSLTLLRFETFKSSSAVIFVDGVGVLLFEEGVGTNLSFSSGGALIKSTGSNCTVNVINSNFSSLNGTDVNGVILQSDGTQNTLWVSGCSIGSILGANGGAFYLRNSNVFINSTSFDECIVGTEGKGGAVYFGLGTSFTLLDSVFSGWSALYGGGIFTDSEETGERILSGVNFTNNSVQSGGNGNDIADNSSIGGSLYSPSTVINCSSNSSNSSFSNFYVIQISGIYDCLLSVSGCVSDLIYVNANGGVDHTACGVSSSPCQSLTQAVHNLNLSSGAEADIVVAPGDYTNTVVVVTSVIIVVYSDSETKPVLSLVSPPVGVLFLFILFFFFFIF